MPRLKKAGAFYSLVFSEKEAIEAGIESEKEFELNKARKGVWVLIDKTALIDSAESAIELKLIELIKSLPLSKRVQGVFEKELNEEELKVFQKLLIEKKVFEFKLNDKYRKAVYKLPEEINEIKEKLSSKDSDGKEKKKTQTVSVDYKILSGDAEARIFSSEHEKEFKEHELKGLKCFDGSYCVIKNDLLNEVSPKIIDYMKSKGNSSLGDISKDLNIPEPLIRIACEFLKEDGMLLEKRKGLIKFIS
ncbi:MAG: hypothetical protein JW703_03770 [Candidatus Diapherotrites archaeon]|nr:hypothetical protein [Candidatus Diapherotrites archaeon]